MREVETETHQRPLAEGGDPDITSPHKPNEAKNINEMRLHTSKLHMQRFDTHSTEQ